MRQGLSYPLAGSSFKLTMLNRDCPLTPLPLFTSYDFCREVGRFHTCQEVLSCLQAAFCWDVSKRGVSLLFHLFGKF